MVRRDDFDPDDSGTAEIGDTDAVLRYVIRAPGFAEPVSMETLVREAEETGLTRYADWDVTESLLPSTKEIHREFFCGDEMCVVRATAGEATTLDGEDHGYILRGHTLFLLGERRRVRTFTIEISPEPFESIWLPPSFRIDGRFSLSCMLDGQPRSWFGSTTDLVDLVIEALARLVQTKKRMLWSSEASQVRIYYIEAILRGETRIPNVSMLPSLGRFDWTDDMIHTLWLDAKRTVEAHVAMPPGS